MEFMSSLQHGFDDLKPSLFELLSEQQLSGLLPPSIRYLLAVATHRHPRYLLRILNSYDELYALVMLLVERHFLLTYGGGFTENFYSLKRERVLRVRGHEIPRAQLRAAGEVRESLKLRGRDVWKNLAVMVGLPYLKRKLDEGYEIHAAHASLLGGYNRNQESLSADATIKQRVLFYYKWFLRRIYPSVNAAYYFSLLAFNLAYLFDGSKYHSPFMWLIGTRIRRFGEADHRAIALATEIKPAATSAGARPGQNTSILHPRTLTHTVYPRLLSSLRILLPASIFALKFLEWWHASDFARQLSRKAAENIELPPPITSGLSLLSPSNRKQQQQQEQQQSQSHPPHQHQDPSAPQHTKSSVSLSDKLTPSLPPRPATTKSPTANPPIAAASLLPILTVPLPANSAHCPICVLPVQNATASPTGYVYCYRCIHQWVEGDHERQTTFMEGGSGEEGWGEDEEVGGGESDGNGAGGDGTGGIGREGRWESGKGRDAVTGRRILGGTEVLRRVVV